MMRTITKLVIILACLLPLGGCNWAKTENQIDNVLLNVHRTLGYTEQARQLNRSLEDSGTIKTETALANVRRLRRAVEYEEKAYAVIKLAINAKESQIGLTAQTKADAEVALAVVQDELLGVVSSDTQGVTAISADRLMTPLNSAVNELLETVRALPVTRKSVKAPREVTKRISMKLEVMDMQFAEVIK